MNTELLMWWIYSTRNILITWWNSNFQSQCVITNKRVWISCLWSQRWTKSVDAWKGRKAVMVTKLRGNYIPLSNMFLWLPAEVDLNTCYWPGSSFILKQVFSIQWRDLLSRKFRYNTEWYRFTVQTTVSNIFPANSDMEVYLQYSAETLGVS